MVELPGPSDPARGHRRRGRDGFDARLKSVNGLSAPRLAV